MKRFALMLAAVSYLIASSAPARKPNNILFATTAPRLRITLIRGQIIYA